MKIETGQACTRLDSTATMIFPVSMGLEIVSAVTNSLLILMMTVAQLNKYDTDSATNTFVTCEIINTILWCKNMLKEVEILQI